MLNFFFVFLQWYFSIGLLVQYGWFITCCLYIGDHNAILTHCRKVGPNEHYYQHYPKTFIALMYTALIVLYPVFLWRLLRALLKSGQTGFPEDE